MGKVIEIELKPDDSIFNQVIVFSKPLPKKSTQDPGPKKTKSETSDKADLQGK